MAKPFYFVIQSWMLEDMKLSLSEAAVYAYIHGLTSSKELEQPGWHGSVRRRYKTKDGKWYYDHPNKRETEFTAHCFEAKFIGNPFIKKFMPDIYSRILAYVENLL